MFRGCRFKTAVHQVQQAPQGGHQVGLAAQKVAHHVGRAQHVGQQLVQQGGMGRRQRVVRRQVDQPFRLARQAADVDQVAAEDDLAQVCHLLRRAVAGRNQAQDMAHGGVEADFLRVGQIAAGHRLFRPQAQTVQHAQKGVAPGAAVLPRPTRLQDGDAGGGIGHQRLVTQHPLGLAGMVQQFRGGHALFIQVGAHDPGDQHPAVKGQELAPDTAIVRLLHRHGRQGAWGLRPELGMDDGIHRLAAAGADEFADDAHAGAGRQDARRQGAGLILFPADPFGQPVVVLEELHFKGDAPRLHRRRRALGLAIGQFHRHRPPRQPAMSPRRTGKPPFPSA
ncbi:MAG: hypothetical protein PW843_16925 [Azospirillaceae bacterium]|nr:hypothetical protein [Azospirillaceae bacterium]